MQKVGNDVQGMYVISSDLQVLNLCHYYDVM